MKNSFGSSITMTLFGESHGAGVGAVIDGIAPGIPVDLEYIEKKMRLRRPYGPISTSREEEDTVEYLSGVYNGYTTGTPLTILIRNRDAKSSDYDIVKDTPRPSHADYTAECKYHGYQDHRGGGHFSGRVTAALVAAGAIFETALSKKGIHIGTHIKSLHGIEDRCFASSPDLLAKDIDELNESQFPALSYEAGSRMKNEILSAKERGDSVGGILETAVIGMPRGVGEPWFDTVEGMLAHALYSIPAVKGVEFGDGFALSHMLGSEANDPFTVGASGIITSSNRSGGINGGITNGMPISFRCAIKPTPTVSLPQRTVSLSSMEETEIAFGGRHDPAIVHRARAVVDAMAAFVLSDMLTARFGTDYLAE